MRFSMTPPRVDTEIFTTSLQFFPPRLHTSIHPARVDPRDVHRVRSRGLTLKRTSSAHAHGTFYFFCLHVHP